MKNIISRTLKHILSSLCLLACLLASNAKAQNYYWDINGATLGAGGATPSGNWEDPNWTTNSTGGDSTITNLPEGVFPRFAAGTDATGSYTVTVNSDHSIAGMLHQSAANATVTISGPGVLSIVSGQQGFFGGTSGTGFIKISSKLSGIGGIVPQSGQIFLDGDNDFSGGVSVGPGLLNFNNSNSFGTGLITIGQSGRALIAEGTDPITITNEFSVTLASANLNCVGNTAGITYSGDVDLGANTFNIGCGGNVANVDIFSGVISGTGNLGRFPSQSPAGIVKFTGDNTYTGKTTLQSGITYANSLNSVSGGSASSSFGAPTTSANGTIGIGLTTFAATLVYVGSGETTDRIIDLAGTTAGGTIQNDGSGALVFTSDFTATGAGAKTLTLSGTNTDANTISGAIVNSTAATSVTKAGAGKWILAGANTYTGNTTLGSSSGVLGIGNVSALGTGTLTISGSTSSFDNTTGGSLTIANGITLSGGSPTFVGSDDLTIDGTALITGAGRTITVSSNTLTLTSGIGDSAQGRAFTKAGAGTLLLVGANTYTGNTTINGGVLALGGSSSLASTNTITIAAGGTLDVSAISAYVMGGTNRLVATGSNTVVGVSAATIKGGTTVDLGTHPISLTFRPTVFTGDTGHPSLTISQGTLSLSGNDFTVNNASGTALDAGTYQIVQQVSGNISSSGAHTVTVTGSGLVPTGKASIQVNGGEIDLVVAVPSPATISTPTILGNGTVQLNFSGTPGASYAIEATTNLNSPIIWTALSTNTADGGGLFNFTDTDATNYPIRFYRTETQ